MNEKQTILDGDAVLGIEFGSSRIKAVLTGENHSTIATGVYDWENQFVNGIWTYSLDDVWEGLQICYRRITEEVLKKYNVEITKIAAIGISGMMHGYMAFDENEKLQVPFRTWRNTMTKEAASALTKEFDFNIPQRWSIAHLYQAILNKEPHVPHIRYITTLSGYIHWKLTGKKVIGIGDASGMFPIDTKTRTYNSKMVESFNKLIEPRAYQWKLEEILPKVLSAGEQAGELTDIGASLLDVSGKLSAGIPFCPPEGDAGTGMVATNSVAVRTGNVSAGTSIFAMVVLEEDLKAVHEELDIVTTPSGDTVAMAHCNNCTSDLNAWVNLFKEFAENYGITVDMNHLFGVLYNKALEGDKNCGGLIAYNYFSGEHVTGLNEGRPMFVRTPNASFNLPNFMRTHLYASLATLKIGCDILFKEERVKVDRIYGHGGLFKTKAVGQTILAAAMNAPVAVMETASEGGPWGMAVLASYMIKKEADENLEDYLARKVFIDQDGNAVRGVEISPDATDVAGFDEYIESYKMALGAERAAVECIPL